MKLNFVLFVGPQHTHANSSIFFIDGVLNVYFQVVEDRGLVLGRTRRVQSWLVDGGLAGFNLI